jgi:hypothetical protein
LQFKPRDESLKFDDREKCLLDNLYAAFLKPENDPNKKPYFLSSLNALSYHLVDSKQKKNICYVVFNGSAPGVYSSWPEVTSIIKNIKHPYYKGFETLSEALSVARQQLGEDCYIAPELRTGPKTAWDNNKVIFCDHCENQRNIIRTTSDELGRANTYIKECHQKIAQLEREIMKGKQK